MISKLSLQRKTGAQGIVHKVHNSTLHIEKYLVWLISYGISTEK